MILQMILGVNMLKSRDIVQVLQVYQANDTIVWGANTKLDNNTTTPPTTGH